MNREEVSKDKPIAALDYAPSSHGERALRRLIWWSLMLTAAGYSSSLAAKLWRLWTEGQATYPFDQTGWWVTAEQVFGWARLVCWLVAALSLVAARRLAPTICLFAVLVHTVQSAIFVFNDFSRSAKWWANQPIDRFIGWLLLQPGSVLFVVALWLLYQPRIVRFAVGR